MLISYWKVSIPFLVDAKLPKLKVGSEKVGSEKVEILVACNLHYLQQKGQK